MEKDKSKKIFLPIIIVLAVLTIAMIALTVVMVLTSSGKSSSPVADDGTEDIEAEFSGDGEYGYVSDYELDDYSTSGDAASDDSQDDPVSVSMEDPNGYLLPNSDTVALTEADLADFTAQELTYARNEIYARHGNVFVSKELNDYFASKTWYVADPSYNAESIEGTELQNAEFIRTYQETHNLQYEPQ